jgi:formate/nitrite transporter FocA (FNT family)
LNISELYDILIQTVYFGGNKMAKNTFLSSFLAGLFISIGGFVFLSLASGGDAMQKVIGAIFFCVGLISICMFGLYLYTGKVGYIVEDHSVKNILTVLVGIIGNFFGTTFFGIVSGFANSKIHDYAYEICSSKLEMNLFKVLFLAFMCGVLMYTAVHIYKTKNTIAGIVFCVPVFILCGFEHSIADMFYFAASRLFGIEYFVFILVVILGNALGGMFVPFVKKFVKE